MGVRPSFDVLFVVVEKGDAEDRGCRAGTRKEGITAVAGVVDGDCAATVLARTRFLGLDRARPRRYAALTVKPRCNCRPEMHHPS